MRILSVVLLAALAVLAGCTDSELSPSAVNEVQTLSTVTVPMPDLILTSLTVEVLPSSRVAYSWTIQNIGTAPANLDGPTNSEVDNVSVQAFLSTDTIAGNDADIPAGGTILGLSPLGYLDPGESISGHFESSTAADPCDYPYLVLLADHGHSVDESDETNNTRATEIHCGPQIDIKPESEPNPINPNSQGVIPVAILGSASFDVTRVDQSSLAFGPSGAGIAHRREHFADVNNDGITDLLAHFRTQETGITVGDTEACLSGMTDDGKPFEACDSIVTVPPGPAGGDWSESQP